MPGAPREVSVNAASFNAKPENRSRFTIGASAVLASRLRVVVGAPGPWPQPGRQAASSPAPWLGPCQGPWQCVVLCAVARWGRVGPCSGRANWGVCCRTMRAAEPLRQRHCCSEVPRARRLLCLGLPSVGPPPAGLIGGPGGGCTAAGSANFAGCGGGCFPPC